MNNFRLTGDSYISKEGNDANDGLTPDTPKATLDNYGNDNVVGSGVYKGAFTFTGTDMSILGDGLVKVSATGTIVISATGNSVINSTSNLVFELNGQELVINSGLSYAFSKVYFLSGTINITTFTPTITVNESIFREITYNGMTNVPLTYSQCTFVNSTILAEVAHTFNNCDFDSITQVTMSAYQPIFNNCNFRGILTVGTTNYELKRDFRGEAIDPNPSITDIIAIDPDIYNRGNFSQDPEYLLNSFSSDNSDYYSISTSSPNVVIDGGRVGAIRVGNSFRPQGNIAESNFTSFDSGSAFRLQEASGADFTTTPIKLADIPQLITNIDLGKLLEFNSDIPKGIKWSTSEGVVKTGENVEVTAVGTYINEAGANPRRLTYGMRWTNNDTPSNTNGWDNNGQAVSGLFSTFEQGTQPKIGSVGNGSPSFTTGDSIVAKWVQIRVFIKEGFLD